MSILNFVSQDELDDLDADPRIAFMTFVNHAQRSLPHSAAFLQKSREFRAKAQDRRAPLARRGARGVSRGAAIKRHSGVQREFARLVKDDPRFDLDLRTFLARAYSLKAIADYETGPGSRVSAERAREAIQTARQFVDFVAGLLPASARTPRPLEAEPRL